MNAQEFIIHTPPYKKIMGEDYDALYVELSKYNLAVDGFNPIRGVETTYHLCSNHIHSGRGTEYKNRFEPVDSNVRILSFRCGRFADILTLAVYNNDEENYLLKIGTYPSLRDFHRDDIKKYEKVLNAKQKTELITAIMIANNGVGIGSYVYLRRIFESIVCEEGEKAIDEGIISKEDFKKKRMDERIIALKNYLPNFLFEHHKELYGILSMGIHQLDEEDCLSFFPILYDCILLILDDRLAQKDKEQTIQKAAASLGKIASKINM